MRLLMLLLFFVRVVVLRLARLRGLLVLLPFLRAVLRLLLTVLQGLLANLVLPALQGSAVFVLPTLLEIVLAVAALLAVLTQLLALVLAFLAQFLPLFLAILAQFAAVLRAVTQGLAARAELLGAAIVVLQALAVRPYALRALGADEFLALATALLQLRPQAIVQAFEAGFVAAGTIEGGHAVEQAWALVTAKGEKAGAPGGDVNPAGLALDV